MQANEAARRRKEWAGRVCDHPAYEKEYDLGAQTGDYVCSQCGEDLGPKQRRAVDARRKT